MNFTRRTNRWEEPFLSVTAWGADCTGLAASRAGRDSALASKPNIIILPVDDMGATDTSVRILTDEGGNPQHHPLNDRCRTPNMERLAALGTRFSISYAHSVRSPTRISILTGQNSARRRATDYIHAFRNNRDVDNES